MCTGLEIGPALAAAMGASTVGNLVQLKEAEDQQDASVAAQNAELAKFLQRNDQRAAEAQSIYDQRTQSIEPEQVKTSQDAAEAKRAERMSAAAAEAPAAAAPVRGSAATAIGDIFGKATAREGARSEAQRAALAKTGSFGDMLFNQGLQTADAGRRIGTIGSFAQSDAALLPSLQNLAGAEASLRNKPGLFGQLLSGAGNAGALYAGNMAGAR